MMELYQRGNETSRALTEVRTVLSRAETGLRTLEAERARDGDPLPDWQLESRWREAYDPHGDGVFHADRDIEDMIDALSETVKRLDMYRRTGKTRRR